MGLSKFLKTIDRGYTPQLMLRSKRTHNSDFGCENRFRNSIASSAPRKRSFWTVVNSSAWGSNSHIASGKILWSHILILFCLGSPRIWTEPLGDTETDHPGGSAFEVPTLFGLETNVLYSFSLSVLTYRELFGGPWKLFMALGWPNISVA